MGVKILDVDIMDENITDKYSLEGDKKIFGGNKDLWTRIVQLLTGISCLALLNFGIFYVIVRPDALWPIFIGVIIMGVAFYWHNRFIKNCRYEFSDKGISIIIPTLFRERKYDIPKSEIISLEKVDKVGWWRGYGVKYDFMNQEVMFTTSRSNLIRIVKKDGKNILISPK